jgi:TRAP-type C4-dicarboxylate transport system substrate-binding protein
MKKLVFASFAIVFMVGLLFSGHAAANAIKLRVGHDLPPFTTPGMGIDAWAKEVNKKTEGRVVVEVFPANALAEQKSAIEMMQAGVADAYMISLGVHRRLFPVSRISSLYGLGFPDTVEGHLAHAKAFSESVEKYPAMANEFKDFKLIFDIINSNNILLSTKPGIRLPTDLKGLKFGQSGIGIEFAKRMGGAGVFCIPHQAYQKLQTGVIDATAIHFLALGEFKLYEVAKYVYDLPWGQAELPFLMSKSSWNKIQAKDQQIIMEAGLVGQRVTFEAGAERTIKGRQAFLDSGGTIATPTKEERAQWEKEFSFFWDQWVAECESAGIANARDILDYWKRASDASWE